MTAEERDQAYHTLITCDGKGKEAKAEALRRLIEWHRRDAENDIRHPAPGSIESPASYR